MKTLLIDTDIFMYKALFGAEEKMQFGEEDFALTVNFDDAKRKFRRKIEDIVERSGAKPLFCMSDDDRNFRKELYPEYKAPRKSTRKPLLLPDMKEWVRTEGEWTYKPGLEADDVIGILATADLLPGKKLIVSIDKDLLQIPGAHYNPDKPDEGVFFVTPEQGERTFYEQVLIGDQVDNYPGCPGIGPVRAKAILEQADNPWDAIVNTFAAVHRRASKKRGEDLDEGVIVDTAVADALVQARLARILTAAEYDFKRQEPKLWEPPQ